MKAYIKKETDTAMWLIVEKEGVDSHTKDFKTSEGVAYPILKDEIPAIYLACREYLYGHGRKKEIECTLSPDCKCEECRTQRDFDNNGGADRW